MEVINNVIIDSPHNQRRMSGDIRFLTNNNQKPVILFVHGFKGFKDWGHFNLIADWFAENDFIYAKFNLSHNGTTPDDPVDIVDLDAFSENNFSIELDDLGAIIDFLLGKESPVPQNEMDPRLLFMIGHSRGGGLTILKAAEDDRIKAIVTWAAIHDVTKMWPEEIIRQWEEDRIFHVENARTGQQMPMKYQIVEDYLQNQGRLDIPKAAASLSIPWLICHGTEDETLDYRMAYDLKSRNKKAELFMIEGANHTFDGGHPYNSSRLLKRTRQLIGRTRDFFREVQSGSH